MSLEVLHEMLKLPSFPCTELATNLPPPTASDALMKHAARPNEIKKYQKLKEKRCDMTRSKAQVHSSQSVPGPRSTNH